MKFDITHALRKLYPEGAKFVQEGIEYSGLKWIDERPKPTETEINDKIKELQDDYDSKQYQRDRADAYPELKEQLDLLWHAIDDGKFNVKSKETDFYKKLKAVKDANPKPE